uniref:Bifunctional inhibitor/plant lipid transfer protein/seed storage helical domain-containing protein n=1 Tax=Lactuca sativa TaxID=4236 RepID=A0A9R1XIY0_LACSA|nr:hypothetical protein LSAT_V11C400158170 [Lactuca sativa]
MHLCGSDVPTIRRVSDTEHGRLPIVRDDRKHGEEVEGTCCLGIKSVLRIDAHYLCEAFKNSAQLGTSLNATKALALPAACDINAPSVTNCGIKPI